VLLGRCFFGEGFVLNMFVEYVVVGEGAVVRKRLG